MDGRMNANPEELLAAERAALWLDRLKAAGPQERAAFLRWLKQSPRHVREMLLATGWDVLLSNIDSDRRIDIEMLMSSVCTNVVPLGRARAPAVEPKHRRFGWPWIVSLAASVTVVAAVLFGSSGSLWGLVRSDRYTTAVGEQRTIALVDGSVVSLNTQSSVRVDFSEEARNVYLREGQVMFAIAQDAARPFRVHVGGAVIQAIGTKFDVRRLKDRTNVAVIEGQVQINTGSDGSVDTTLAELSDRARLAAGESASIIVNGQVTPPAAIDVTDVTAWQRRRLIFRGNTLAEIVDEFGRYNRTPRIRIEGDEVGAKRYSGVFDADDPENLLEYLKSDAAVVLERRGQELIIRLQPSAVGSVTEG